MQLKFLALCTLFVVLDQVSKEWADSRGLVTLNRGISFAWLGEWSTMLLVVVSVVVLCLVGWWWQRSFPAEVGGRALFLAGGMGNILDRIRVGAVRDWLPIPGLQLQNNVADWMIFAGVLIFLLARNNTRVITYVRNFIRR